MDEKTRKAFAELTAKTHTQQGQWYLNGFWEAHGISADSKRTRAEEVYDFVQKFKEIEYGQPVVYRKGKGAALVEEYKEGSDLDEFKSHKFLESLGEVLTVVALRKKLEIIDLDKNHRMSIAEYLVFKYALSAKAIVDSPQGGNTKELQEAQAKMEEVSAALADVQGRLADQKIALAEATSTKAASDKALAESEAALAAQQQAEAEVKKAEAELQAAVDDLKKQEDDYHLKCSTLEAKTNDASASSMSRSKAANELAQAKAEDPLPLRKAKITQEAALKKVQKQRKAAEAATAAATQKKEAAAAAADSAAKAQAELEEQTRQLEAAEADLNTKAQEAEDALNAIKAKGAGVANGAIWWMEKELKEARKYMAKKK